MANSTCLALFQNVLQQLGIAGASSPATVVGNSNQDVLQTLALTNAAGDELAREHQWQSGTVEYRFTTVFYQYTATTTADSTTISALSSTTGLTTTPTYFSVTGSGVPQDTMLVSVNAGASTAVLSRAATASDTVTLTFAQVLYAFPTDYDRLVDRTEWDKSQQWELIGPSTGQQWQWLKSGWVASGPRVRFRPLGGFFQIWPAITANHYLGFEYQSKYWVLATAGTSVSKQSFTVDTDTCIFPDPLMRALIKLKYLEVKGFDTTAARLAYETQRDLAKAHDAGSQTLSMAPRPSDILIGWENIPDSGYGS